jgi:hypothetical protein
MVLIGTVYSFDKHLTTIHRLFVRTVTDDCYDLHANTVVDMVGEES